MFLYKKLIFKTYESLNYNHLYMGSKGLWAFIQPIIKRIPLDNLRNKRLILDIILYLHKQIIGIRNKGRDIVNNRGKNINHLVSLYNILKNLISIDILPICVFDGKPPELKKQTIIIT